MNYVESLNMFGVPAKEIPCIKGRGVPSSATEGAVGMFYMNTDNGDLYKCTAATESGNTWEEVSGSSGISVVATREWYDGDVKKTTKTLQMPDGSLIDVGEGKNGTDGIDGAGIYLWDFSAEPMDTDEDGNKIYKFADVTKPDGSNIEHGDLLLDYEGNVYRVEGMGMLTFASVFQFCLSSGSGESGVLCVTVDYGEMIASHSPAEILEAVNSGKGVCLCVFNSDGVVALSLVGVDTDSGKAEFCATVYDELVFGQRLGILHASVYANKAVTFANDGAVLSMCVPIAENVDIGKVLSVSDNGLAWVNLPEGGTGKDGVSATHSWSGTVLTVTSASGTSSADLKGETGASGKDGVSPTVTVTDITGGHRVAITDANGTKTFDVMDGKDGESGSGVGSGIPVIDLRELGFPDIDGPGYSKNVMFDQNTYNTLKAKIEYGVVAIKMYANFGALTLTCHSEIYETPTATEHYAVCISSDGYKNSFMLGYGDGMYGASFYLYDK